jgi:hypothetical protein
MTNWSDVTRHNQYCKHDKTKNEGSASKQQKETKDIMDKSEEFDNNGFFDDNGLCSTVAPEEEAREVEKMLRLFLVHQIFAFSQHFLASENVGTGLVCELLVGQSQFQLTNW